MVLRIIFFLFRQICKNSIVVYIRVFLFRFSQYAQCHTVEVTVCSNIETVNTFISYQLFYFINY